MDFLGEQIGADDDGRVLARMGGGEGEVKGGCLRF